MVSLLIDFDSVELAAPENPGDWIDEILMDVERDSPQETSLGIKNVLDIPPAVRRALPGLDEEMAFVVDKKLLNAAWAEGQGCLTGPLDLG